MQNLRHFNFVFYVMLLIGFAGFAIAADAPGVFLLAASIVGLRTFLGRNRFLSLPSSAISWLGVAAVLFCAVSIVRGQTTAVLGFSHLLVFLILVKLFDQRGNRDLAQVMVMSLLLMTAAAINSASLLYGLLFIIHLLLGLYLSLMLHLKSETDSANSWMRLRPTGVPLPADSVAMQRSLRRLSATIALFAIVAGVGAFLFIPRSRVPAAGISLARQSAPMTGFSERVSFEQVARITQSREMVAHVTLRQGGQPYKPGSFYLRGTTLNLYTGATPVDREGSRWQWFRSPLSSGNDRPLALAPGEPLPVIPDSPLPNNAVEILVDLEPTGSRVLFFLPGVSRVWSQRSLTADYHPSDGSIKAGEALRSLLRYGGLCTMELGGEVPDVPRLGLLPDSPRRFRSFRRWLPSASRIDPRIETYARRPEVSGTDARGVSLAATRPAGTPPADGDEAIARAIESHLRSQFAYTLDLTDTSRDSDEDPLVAFLYDFRRGHCEYFAGAMTLMCQSLGLKARMAIGFRVDAADYNSIGNYYVVRQSNAHAWVEVLTSRGWLQFDPTSGNLSSPQQRSSTSLADQARDLWDYLQYRWAAGVVTYSEENRHTLIERVTTGMQAGSSWANDAASAFRQWVREGAAYQYSFNILEATISFFILFALAAVLFYFYERYRLRRRAKRLGLDAESAQEQRRITRQLAFYESLLLLLERQGVRRLPSQTPREFARSLTHLPARSYRQMLGLTEVFYRIRFGGRLLSPIRAKWVNSILRDLSRTIEKLPVQSGSQ